MIAAYVGYKLGSSWGGWTSWRARPPTSWNASKWKKTCVS